jgi:GntR family transcriptional regulator, transcriptional repressor for pyruvate dehydrogenase complex
MFKPIKHVKVSDEIVDQIRNLISQGKLKPGDRLLPERELIREFDVSRPSLREALNSLITMGFLEIKGKKTFIKSVASESMQNPLSLIIKADTQKIFDLIEVRKAIETWGAFLAAQRATEEDIKQLENIIEGMKKAFEEGRSWEKQDADFHLGIAQATHNTIQTHMMSTIYDLLRESVAKVFKDRAKVKKLLDHHQRIFNAIKNHSPDKAKERILEHLDYVESEVKASTAQKE